jgi:hypothetical protein
VTCTELARGGFFCGDEMREVRRERDGGERWCFVERKRRAFDLVVTAPVGPSYYGPNPSIRCASCGTTDADLFPGRVREWDA